MLSETLLIFLSLWLVNVLQCRPLIGCRENTVTCHRQIPVWFHKITGGFLYAFSEYKLPLYGLWRGLLKAFSKLVSNFKWKKLNCKYDYFINKKTKNCKSRQPMYREYLFNIISLKKYSSRDTIPSTKLRSFLTFTNEERVNNACRAESTNGNSVHMYEYE
jgi:hypothetical protein